jgi:hypothetical protein
MRASSAPYTIVRIQVMNPRLKPVDLSLARTPCVFRDVRLHDGSPAKNTYVLSSDCVGMTSAAPRHTTEARLIGAVGLVDISTCWTCATWIPRINQHHGNTGPLCFVANKEAKLSERPAMQLSALLSASPRPRVNTLADWRFLPPPGYPLGAVWASAPMVCPTCYR